MTDKKSYVEVSEKFLEFEEERGLFDITIQEIPIWERIRFQVHTSILESSGVTGQAHENQSSDSLPQRYLAALKSILKEGVARNPYSSRSHKILVWGHERRKQLDDGYWWDIYCDPIYEELDLDYLHLETQYKDGHKTPAKTDTLRYSDFIENLSRLWRKVGEATGQIEISSPELDEIANLQSTIQEGFGVKLDIVERVRYLLTLRYPLRRLYRMLLKRIDPAVVIIVVSYGRHTFIEVCKELDIPVVELQHGIIHPYHMGYSYPGDREKTTFPDYLFTFGDYWKETVDLPIPSDRVISIGYPYLEQRKEEFEDVPAKEQILFVSQGTVGAELSRFATELSKTLRSNHNIVFKLHPGEYDRWRTEYPWLLEANLRVIDDDSTPLYRLFAESTVQVGVNSTALFEGLNFDLQTYLVTLPGINVMEGLYEQEYATKVASTDELQKELENDGDSKKIKTNKLFKPNPIVNFEQELQEMINQ